MTDPNVPIDPCDEDRTGEPDPCERARTPGDITEDEVKCAQKEWCEGLLDISDKYWYPERGDYRRAAIDFINRLYDFGPDGGMVFFRPTLAEFPYNFRTTFEGTLSYFIGESDFPDKGFAKNKFISATYSNRLDEETTGIQLNGRTAVAMGNVCLKEELPNGEINNIVVDKVFVYRKDTNYNLKLIVHMSAKRNGPGETAIE